MKSLALLLIALNVSCAGQRMLTREEWQAAGQMTFNDVSKKELIEKAQQVLTLADGEDVKFTFRNNGFSASRPWLVYAVIAITNGTDYWVFDVEDKDGSLLATVQASSASSAITPYAVGGQVGTVSTTSFGTPIQGTAIYDMFWGRLDYLLDRRKDWPDCRSGLQKIRRGETWGNLDQICDSVTLIDDAPANLSDAEIARVFKGREPALEKYLKRHQPEKYEAYRKSNGSDWQR